jgi:hypothetical protein
LSPKDSDKLQKLNYTKAKLILLREKANCTARLNNIPLTLACNIIKIHYGGDNSKLDNAGFSWHGTDNITEKKKKKNAHAKSEPHAQLALSLSYTSKIALFCI